MQAPGPLPEAAGGGSGAALPPSYSAPTAAWSKRIGSKAVPASGAPVLTIHRKPPQMRTRGKPEAGGGGGASSAAAEPSGADAMALADELVERVASVDSDLAVAVAAGAVAESTFVDDRDVAKHVEAAICAGDDAEHEAKDERSRALVKRDRDRRAASPARCASAHKGRAGASPGRAASPGKAAFGSSCSTARQLVCDE